MESRGPNFDERSKGRPAIVRRSCDHCRARKIACDRGSPCSNCISARLECNHSLIASNKAAPKQRISVSTQYEQKIDGIAKSVDGIRAHLQRLDLSQFGNGPTLSPTWQSSQANSATPIAPRVDEPVWDHPAHIIDFVKAVVEDLVSKDVGAEGNQVISSLRKIVQTLEDPTRSPNLSRSGPQIVKDQTKSPMPPLEAVVAVLKWARDHEGYARISAISQILPLQHFIDICRKVYFSIDGYSDTDFILANGFLYSIFSQHIVGSGLPDYQTYSQYCRANLEDTVSQLPLLLPASMDMIAVLVLGAFNAIENSQATVAWTFISAASDLCLRLGYHQLHPLRDRNQNAQPAQTRLFWTVYKIEKGLSLRLGRSSNIRDDDITTPLDADVLPRISLAKIQGIIYDQLYSPLGLSQKDADRDRIVRELSADLRKLINATHVEISSATNQSHDLEADPMRVIYLRCDIVCELSCLALVLRAAESPQSSFNGISEDCVMVAREALDMHQQCMVNIRTCKNDSSQITKYINCTIMHGPFVPFNILFTRAVQYADTIDLARLDSFAASLGYEDTSPKPTTHPYRLYELLCKGARLYFESTTSVSTDPTLTEHHHKTLGDFGFAQLGNEANTGEDDISERGGDQTYALSDWYYGNQQMMSLFEEDLNF